MPERRAESRQRLGARAAGQDLDPGDGGAGDEDRAERPARRRPAASRPRRGDDGGSRRRRAVTGDDDSVNTAERRAAQDDGESEAGGTADRVTARKRRRGSAGMSAGDAARAGMRELRDLISKRPEGITAVEPTEDGWLVGVEVLEEQRVPSSADILAIYEAELDADGTLLSYRRTKRYPRGRGDREGEDR
jgi:hypothetical protein